MKKIKIILVILFFICSQAITFSSTLKFAQISDLHYQSNVLRKNVNYYALPIIDNVAENINADEKVKFTLITGDIINKRKYDDAQFIYSHFNEIFKNPWYSVFGNHDLGGKVIFKFRLLNLLADINNFFSGNKKDYYSFKPASDIIFIGLNSNYLLKRTPVGYISKTQLKYLDYIFSQAKKSDVIVIFMHHTPIDFPSMHNNHFIFNEKEFMSLLKSKSNPVLLLGGHYHACKIERENNIIKVATPSLTTIPLAYRVIEIDNTITRTIFNFEYKEVDFLLQEYIFKYLKIKENSTRNGREYDKNISILVQKI